LHFAPIRPEEENPVQTVATFETDHVGVERPTLVEALRQDVRLNPLYGHAASLGRTVG
jgi:hypothetical protein